MTAAGVQNLDSAAYVPPAPSASAPDVKTTSATDKQNLDTNDGQPDFQSELELQQTATQATDSAGQPKATSGKPEKKRDKQADDAKLAVATPVQVAEPQKQILPLVLALPKLDDNAKLDENPQSGEKATPDVTAQEPLQVAAQAQQALSKSLTPGVPLTELRQPEAPKQPAASKQSARLRPSTTPVDALPSSAASAAPSAAFDSSKTQILQPASGLPLAPQVPAPYGASKSEDSSPQDQVQIQTQAQAQARASAKTGVSSDNQPISRTQLSLPATPAEPVAKAVQETVESVPSSPSALAFAARLAAAPQNTVEPGSADPSQSPAVSGPQTSAQIPVRHAATAQIIQSAALGTQQDGPKRDTGSWLDKPARPEARTDMVLPRFESVSEAAPSSGSTATQQAAPTARPESIIEPPAAPPTSSHDIRVRVPDDNGGSTQVRFVESGGQVRVSVRTADDGLAQNLRTHLNDLTQRLSDGGISADIWKPVSNTQSSQNDQHQPNQEGRGSGGQGSGGQSGQQDRQQKRPAWLEEMEASLHGEQI